jgi:cytochrome c peroxidase
LNAAYIDLERGAWQTWDGRGDSLWGGNLLPLERSTSNNATRLQLAHVVFDHYQADYEAVFGPLPALSDQARFPATGMPGDAGFDAMAADDRDAVNQVFANIGKALAAYERRLISTGFAPSAFDHMLAGDDEAMTPAAIRGARLFIGKAACDDCHRGAAFADQLFHNIGVPQEGERAFATDVGRYDAIARIKNSIFNRAGAFSDAPDDAHLRDLTERPRDIGAFKTPTLRNVAKTAPYMHDGVYGTLGEVVTHYNVGGSTGTYAGTREVTISPLLLDSDEVDDLVEFMRALDDGDPLPTPDFPEGLVAVPALPD